MENRHTGSHLSGFYVVTGTLLFWCPVTLSSHTVIELTLLGYLTLDMKHFLFLVQLAFPQVSQCISVWTFTALAKAVFLFPSVFHTDHCWGQHTDPSLLTIK